MKDKMINWLNEGDGGEWFEPYVTNKDVITIISISLFVGTIIVFGTYLTTN